MDKINGKVEKKSKVETPTELPKLLAKDKHRLNLLRFLANWNNPWPKNQIQMSEIIGIKPDTLRFHFTHGELHEIENEGLEMRKKNSSRQRASVYIAMLDGAEGGNTTAQNNFLDRTEGKVTEKIQHGFDNIALEAILSALPAEYADAVKKKLAEIAIK